MPKKWGFQESSLRNWNKCRVAISDVHQQEPVFCRQSEFRIGVEIVWSVLVLACIRSQQSLRDRDGVLRRIWWKLLSENNRRQGICNRMLRRRPITVA